MNFDSPSASSHWYALCFDLRMDTIANSLIHLEALCRGELAAVETYNTALSSGSLGRFRAELTQCQRSHQNRVNLLGWRIHLLGGIPPESSGAWGIFVNALESAAAAVSERSAVSTLEEGEDHGLNEYRTRLHELDADTQQFVTARLLPGQAETHDLAQGLRMRVAEAAELV